MQIKKFHTILSIKDVWNNIKYCPFNTFITELYISLMLFLIFAAPQWAPTIRGSITAMMYI